MKFRHVSRVALTFCGAFVVLLIAGCSAPQQDQAIEFRVPVFAREVGTGTVEDRVVATGTLRAPEMIALRAQTAGVLQVARSSDGSRLAEGDRVSAGDIVAEITGEDVRLAASTDSTHQRYMTAKRDYDSRKALHEQGLISELDFHQAETTLADAKIEWERSLFTESRSKLVSNIDGMILRLARDESETPLADGQLVTAGQVIAEIAPTNSLIADVDLIGADLSRVREGLSARVRHHAWDDRTFAGTVLRLAPSLDPVTRTLRAEVAVSNAERLLRPGMFVEVTMIADRREDVPVVPREAVTERGGAKVVFVLNGQRVARREVTLGLGDDEVVEVRNGVEPGERVVVRGIETLTDGTRVRASGS